MITIWQEEYIKSVSNSLMLVKNQDDTSLRQGFILLDNAFEQFMKDSLNNKLKKKNEYYKFHVLLNEFQKEFEISYEIIHRIKEFHEIRNALYHKSTYFSVTSNRFQDYLKINSLICEELNLSNLCNFVKTQVRKTEKIIFERIMQNLRKQKSMVFNEVSSIIIDNFKLVGTDFVGNFILGSPIGYTNGAVKNMMFVSKNFLRCSDGKMRILELIESNEENAMHSYFVTFESIRTWYCYIDCLWSKYGNGEDRYIKQIREFIKINNNRIVYKQDFIRKGKLEKAFSLGEY